MIIFALLPPENRNIRNPDLEKDKAKKKPRILIFEMTTRQRQHVARIRKLPTRHPLQILLQRPFDPLFGFSI
jgi:hypothetical protein